MWYSTQNLSFVYQTLTPCRHKRWNFKVCVSFSSFADGGGCSHLGLTAVAMDKRNSGSIQSTEHPQKLFCSKIHFSTLHLVCSILTARPKYCMAHWPPSQAYISTCPLLCHRSEQLSPAHVTREHPPFCLWSYGHININEEKVVYWPRLFVGCCC